MLKEREERFLALIAHDDKKDDMIALVQRRYAVFAQQRLVATQTTGTLIEQQTDLQITKMLSGPLGGDLQIGALIATDQIRAVIFLRDPLTAHPHEPDISALMKVCDTHNIPLATNVATAELILRYLSLEAPATEEI
ncbi:MAG TPA: methylglyoxal synthase [Chthonomonadaceae bacterium]|nr:methylglyoxal synthase [Chthonomonadaceae bacterium]